jgi:hypothetical protein
MLRDNPAGLIEPMIDCAGADPFGGHPKQGPTGGCSRSTVLTIVVLKRSWRPTFRWKTGRQTEKAKRPGFEVITVAHDSRAVGTALHQSHRTIDPQCLKKSPPRRGGIYALTENVSSPFHAEPTQRCFHCILKASTGTTGLPRSGLPQQHPWQTKICPSKTRTVFVEPSKRFILENIPGASGFELI